MADVIASHGVWYHQYADDTQLHLAMRADNTDDGLFVLAACITNVKQWYMQNGLQLNPDKSEVLLMEMTNQLRAASCLTSLQCICCWRRPARGGQHESPRRHS